MKIRRLAAAEPWKEALQKYKDVDVYHTYDYAQACKFEASAEYFLLQVSDGDRELVFPVVENRVASQSETSLSTDLLSVYGYPGPLFVGDWSSERLESVWQHVRDYFREHSVVCLSSRLNPFSTANVDLSCIGLQRKVSEVVAIDLSKTDAEQLSNYRSNHRRDIRKLKKTGVRCEKVNALEFLDVFVELYEQTMNRLDAKDSYYFNRDYYLGLLDAEDFETELYLCFNEKEVPICAGLFFICGEMVHYHLGGTATESLRQAPTKLMFDTVREAWSMKDKLWLNLGGGLGGQDDSLLNFKAGFSSNRFDYSMFFSVFDQKSYDSLVADRLLEAEKSGCTLDQDFVPQYRAPLEQP